VWPVGLLVLIKAAAEGIFAQTAKYALHPILRRLFSLWQTLQVFEFEKKYAMCYKQDI
jgi:hypothetical protein